MSKRNYIPESVKKQCVEMALEGMTYKEVYKTYYSKHYNTKFSGFRSCIKRWKKKYLEDKKYIEETNFNYGYGVERVTVQRDSKGDITQTWIKYKEADEQYDEIKNVIANLKPFEKIEKIKENFKHKMLEIPFTDMHFGIATYDDYKQTLQETILKIEQGYDEINILMGEDLLHTDDLKGHTSNQTFIGAVDVPKAYNDALRFYFELVETSLKHSNRTRVIYSMGNHSETLSWTIVQVLKAKYPQAEYDDRLVPRKTLTYHEILIGIAHMDKGKKNLRDVKELFVEENLMAYAKAKVKEIHLGHLHHDTHTGDVNGCVVRRLSTKAPTDKWHYDMGFTMSTKRFNLFEYSRDRLLAVYYV